MSDQPSGVTRRRPGGRTARTRQAVADAVAALVTEGRAVTFAEVAARSGTNATTLYRRWATVPILEVDVLREQVEPDVEPCDGRDLRTCLHAYAARLAAGLATPRGVTYLSALTRIASDPRGSVPVGEDVAASRLASYAGLLDAHPQARLAPRDLLDGLFAPLSLHALLATPFDPDGADVAQYVDNLIRLSESRVRATAATIADPASTEAMQTQRNLQ